MMPPVSKTGKVVDSAAAFYRFVFLAQYDSCEDAQFVAEIVEIG